MIKLSIWFLQIKILIFNNILLQVNDHEFELVDNLKFLGIVVNHKLKWHEHINVVCNKNSKKYWYFYINFIFIL